jgi:hypothetical protein
MYVPYASSLLEGKKKKTTEAYLELELLTLDDLRLLIIEGKVVGESDLLAGLVEGSLGSGSLGGDDGDGSDDAEQKE